MSDENGQPGQEYRDQPAPPASGAWELDGFSWFWNHTNPDKVVLTISPTVSIQDPSSGHVQQLRDGPLIRLVFTLEGWKLFSDDVARGGHTPQVSGLAIARDLPRELKQ